MKRIVSDNGLQRLLDGLDEDVLRISDAALVRESVKGNTHAAHLRKMIAIAIRSQGHSEQLSGAISADPTMSRKLLALLLAPRRRSAAARIRFKGTDELSDDVIEEMLKDLLKDDKKG